MGDWVIKWRRFHCISGRCIWYLRLGWGICSSLWSLSSLQALLLNTALLLSALRQILAFVPINLRSSGRRNDSYLVPFCTLTCYAECTILTWQTATVPVWWLEPFPGNSISRWLCEWITPARGLAKMDATAAIHANALAGCCSVHRDLLQSVSHLHRRVTVQVVMFRGLYLLRQMFIALAKFQQTVIFTSGPWGRLKARWFSCLLSMLILFSEWPQYCSFQVSLHTQNANKFHKFHLRGPWLFFFSSLLKCKIKGKVGMKCFYFHLKQRNIKS